MEANQLERTQSQLLDAAIDMLTRRLPTNWVIEKISLGGDPEAQDLIIKGPQPSSQTPVAVVARSVVSVRDVQVLMGGPWRRLRKQLGYYPILVIAPYVSPKVRELLVEESVSYVDLTGNIRISLDQVGVFIETQGAQRDPSATKSRRGLRGAKVGAVVRVLVDAAPPYTGAEIAKAANVNEGYVSRILETLGDEGLIERESPGPVTGVDWPAVLRRRAQVLDLFRPTGSFRYIARQGARGLVEQLAARGPEGALTISGSFAAARLAPVAAPTLLVIYTMSPRDLAQELDLLPAETGADVVLVRPDNEVVFARAVQDGGLVWAAPSQVAMDCLAGSGRMPAEGDAVVDWMRETESTWRYPSIEAMAEATERGVSGD
ncbi:MAG: hypothetical protein WD096_10895 [Actinomycetota bacterium]